MGLWNKVKRIESPEQAKARRDKERIASLDRFHGNLEEYILLKKEEGTLLGHETIVPMPIGRSNKWICDPKPSSRVHSEDYSAWEREYSLLVQLIDKGCIALIRYDPFNTDISYSRGLPVRIKRPEDPYRK